ncbi:recombinase family protein [Microbacterium caowuchunii]|uniref:Recombinase family protein n=1 Tax=Microbacterium caowuchunii TaxID=2614638 RepID=A0A5N0TAL0_9MICO|nr:recombinase family protein [Microbacterium caowuchunii]KAA9131167.1 recombinase family protein [Microbacterium caowuchunii]
MASDTVQAAIYVRQSVREDQGIAQQIADCRRRLVAEEWAEVDVYDDNRTSATKDRGTGTAWARMLEDIDAGRVQVVVAVAAARLLRRVEDVLELTKRDVRIVTLRDGIDTATNGGKMMLYMLVLMAEAEIEEKEARALPYRASRREAGHPTSGLVPYGYRWVPKLERDAKGTRFAIVPEEAEIIRYMSAELLGGTTLAAIVDALNADGKRTRAGARWRSSTVRRILISPFHAAKLPPAMPEGKPYRADRFTWSECTPGTWAEILPEDAVLAARGLLLDDARRSHDGDTRPKWLLSTIGRCAGCHGPLRSAQTKTTATSYRAYRCTAGCFVRPAALIEEYVTRAAVDVLSAPGLLSWVDDDPESIEVLRARREALSALRAEDEELYRARKLSPAMFSRLVDENAAEIADIDRELAEIVRVNPLAAFVSGDDVRDLWDGLSVGRRRAVLSALVDHVEVSPVGKGRRVLTVEAVEGTVSMGWRRVERRRSLDTGATTRTPKVPDEARNAIVRALNK